MSEQVHSRAGVEPRPGTPDPLITEARDLVSRDLANGFSVDADHIVGDRPVESALHERYRWLADLAAELHHARAVDPNQYDPLDPMHIPAPSPQVMAALDLYRAGLEYALRHADVASRSDVGDPVGLIEIAHRLQVAEQTVRNWPQRPATRFPEPRWTVGGRPAWSWPADIEPWAIDTGRLRWRPAGAHRWWIVGDRPPEAPWW